MTKAVKTFGVDSVQNVPIRVRVKLEDFNADDETEDWPFREIAGSLMWLPISTRTGISNAVRSVAKYSSAPEGIAVYSYILMALHNMVLHVKEEQQRVFLWKSLPIQTTPVRQRTGGLCQAERFCVQVHAYIGFLGHMMSRPLYSEYITLVDAVKELLV